MNLVICVKHDGSAMLNIFTDIGNQDLRCQIKDEELEYILNSKTSLVGWSNWTISYHPLFPTPFCLKVTSILQLSSFHNNWTWIKITNPWPSDKQLSSCKLEHSILIGLIQSDKSVILTNIARPAPNPDLLCSSNSAYCTILSFGSSLLGVKFVITCAHLESGQMKASASHI